MFVQGHTSDKWQNMDLIPTPMIFPSHYVVYEILWAGKSVLEFDSIQWTSTRFLLEFFFFFF